MLKLKQLKFNNIGRFVEEQSIDLTSLGNLVQVDGQNNNTGGSSGSGKTTIFNALDYLLGLNDVPNTTLQSRLTKEGISVTGIFDLDGKELTVSRVKGKLAIDLEGDVTTGSSKLSEERLDQILAMPRHLFRPMLHKRQKEGGFFLQFTPKEMNEFLTDCLGLGDYRLKLDIIEKKLKELEDHKIILSNDLESNKAALKATQEAILSLGLPPVRTIHRETLVGLKSKSDASLEALKAVEALHAEQNAKLDLEQPSVQFSAYNNTVLETHQKLLKDLNAQLADLNIAEKERQAEVQKLITDKNLLKSTFLHVESQGRVAIAEAKTAATQLQRIRESVCPTCEQNWATENAKKTENLILTNLLSYKEKIALGVSATSEIARLQSEIELLQPQLALKPANTTEITDKIASLTVLIDQEKTRAAAHHNEYSSKNKTILQEFALKQQALRQSHTIQMSQVRGQADLDRKTLDAAIIHMKSHEESKVRYDTSISNLKTQEQSYEARLYGVSASLEVIKAEILIVEEIKRAVKSYISCSFDDALEIIGDTATRIIRSIPNMSNATIKLEGIKETKEGKVKEEVNASISLDGDIGVPIKSLSGGERSSVDLAVDLAVIDLIENKTGKGIDLFILDEPFTGLDTASIEMAIEVLRNSNINKRLIIVDHNEVVKEMVETKLLVVREGSFSKISQ